MTQLCTAVLSTQLYLLRTSRYPEACDLLVRAGYELPKLTAQVGNDLLGRGLAAIVTTSYDN